MTQQCEDSTGPDDSVCGLPSGHDGDHWATVAQSDDGRQCVGWRWSQMPPLERRLDMTRCGAVYWTDPRVLACSEDAGHQGPHRSQQHDGGLVTEWSGR